MQGGRWINAATYRATGGVAVIADARSSSTNDQTCNQTKETALCGSVEDTIATTMGANAAAARARLGLTASQPRRREFGTWERGGAVATHTYTRSTSLRRLSVSQAWLGMSFVREDGEPLCEVCAYHDVRRNPAEFGSIFRFG